MDNIESLNAGWADPDAPVAEDYRCGTVALLGRPNVGKSTLMNRIVGAKVAIVTPKPQTTRHRILGIHTDEHSQMVFVDTPGIHKGDKQLNRNMVRVAYAAAEEADVLVIMQDLSKPMDHATSTLIKGFADGRLKQPRLHVLNKVDQMTHAALLPRLAEVQRLDPDAAAYIPLSARKGVQVDALLKEITRLLPEAPPVYAADWFTDQSQRQLAAEYVREQVFLAMQQEIPFQTAVEIEAFGEDETGMSIEAAILVGSERHKPMLIGKGGERMKDIGTKARKGLQDLFDCPVDLRLWVRVQPDWFDNPGRLQDLGLDG
ncbi:MAG: GTPase Era [Zetaproteobacteria bacterium CG06_land_8_20_14_3_00_59_53]|nr:MAG: GTPase Era [Zetaproteobacteria bacterium CG23_combo_of_CG06-09_8_20_14_all_59_86]PIQ64715.1 MAG: GTPase Era [Zetaproteobacteria bacterium CG11_big_fil_rev_8_21_14_0_20_59_439]PIU71119.1 MAG: GTPase Era [Zetaproteobacteria bacterium CG06_land_8_20_14_3_00_59_53]PIU96613.1 MAG: GTPase Era [Zetaproteobacteria bacterium CG03_land_8_20_14_0_80_59_51]PIY46216.1 MAG: GTPase Era [Zetaproteobacteria bacterium CG_4_10_14_0_8_um_filter_59_127]PJC16703.1 MAG: GTPase Era [Zetaproteobacteria bacteri